MRFIHFWSGYYLERFRPGCFSSYRSPYLPALVLFSLLNDVPTVFIVQKLIQKVPVLIENVILKDGVVRIGSSARHRARVPPPHEGDILAD